MTVEHYPDSRGTGAWVVKASHHNPRAGVTWVVAKVYNEGNRPAAEAEVRIALARAVAIGRV